MVDDALGPQVHHAKHHVVPCAARARRRSASPSGALDCARDVRCDCSDPCSQKAAASPVPTVGTGTVADSGSSAWRVRQSALPSPPCPPPKYWRRAPAPPLATARRTLSTTRNDQYLHHMVLQCMQDLNLRSMAVTLGSFASILHTRTPCGMNDLVKLQRTTTSRKLVMFRLVRFYAHAQGPADEKRQKQDAVPWHANQGTRGPSGPVSVLLARGRAGAHTRLITKAGAHRAGERQARSHARQPLAPTHICLRVAVICASSAPPCNHDRSTLLPARQSAKLHAQHAQEHARSTVVVVGGGGGGGDRQTGKASV